MKQGRTLQDLAQEVARQSEMKADFVVDSRELALRVPVAEHDYLGPEDRPAWDRGDGPPELILPNDVGVYRMREHAQRQLSDRISYPFRLWERFRADHPDLLERDINTLMSREPKRRMIRCFDGGDDGGVARAVLSDRYRRRDNDEVLAHVVPILADLPDARVESCQVTDAHLYLKVIVPSVAAEPKVGETVCAGVVIQNSEVGSGSLRIRPMIYTWICTNGMIAGKDTRYLHVGRQVDSDEAMRVFRDETVEADDKAFFLKLADVVKAAVDETTFNAIVTQMREAAGTPPMPEPVEGMERLAQRFDLSEGEKRGALRYLIEGKDLTAYGAVNALTRVSQDVENYERATELEEAGGVLLGVPGPEWERLAGVR